MRLDMLLATLAAVISVGCTVVAEEVTGFGQAKILRRSSQLKEAYDYVIVGAGTAGLTLADRLTADGKCMIPNASNQTFLTSVRHCSGNRVWLPWYVITTWFGPTNSYLLQSLTKPSRIAMGAHSTILASGTT